jgi:hypothetical protein
MAQRPRRRSARKKSARGKLVPGVLIRGADGRLYLVRKDKLGPFKLPKRKAKELGEILGEVSLTVPKLPQDVVKRIHVCLECVPCPYPVIDL